VSVDPALRNIRLLVQYDGTDFCGWQRQNGVRTVQGDVTRAIEEIVHHPVKLGGSSRTDAGVHAVGMPANFQTSRDIPLIGFIRGVNDKLGHDVAVLEAEEVPEGWDARRDALAKSYCYRYLLGQSRMPLLDRTSWWVRRDSLDIDAMHRAAQSFVGSHDFSSFRASKCVARTRQRFMHSLEVYGSHDGNQVVLRIVGNAFLTHMVRIMAGTLFRVGIGQTTVAEVAEILAAQERSCAGMTAPSRGLTLEKVYFEGYPRIGKLAPGSIVAP
jgi:tRNA pseudouridine38-40 synthase